MKKSLLMGIAAASALALSACGSAAPGSPQASGTKSPLIKTTVGVLPIIDTAPIWLGKEKGFFADEGIDLQIEAGGGGAAALPAVVAGSFDFAFGNYVSLMVARDKGLDLKVVTNGNSNAGAPSSGSVIVRADSPLKSPADLTGKTVAVNNLSNINDITIRSIVDADGGDSSTIKFVELAAADNEAAVEKKQVDAARAPGPFDQIAVADGARVLFYNYPEFDANLDIAGYFTTADNVKNKPEMVRGFKAAMNKSLDYAKNHPDDVRRIVTTYTKLTPAQLANVLLPEFRVDFNRQSIQKLGAAAREYGAIKSEPNLNDLLP
jgi:NitT/TauT family transport system substrate-binding protein